MKPQVISLQCVLKNSAGRWISTTFSKDVFSSAPAGEAIDLPALAKNLQNVHKGERRSIELEAREAFGLYDPNLLLHLTREQVPSGSKMKRGDKIRMSDSRGLAREYRVTDVRGDIITLDANHPLAGQDLVFDVFIVEAREATEADLLDSLASETSKYLH